MAAPTAPLVPIARVELPAVTYEQGELAEYRQTAEQVLEWSKGLTIAGDETLGEAIAKLGDLAEVERTAEKRRKEWVKPANDWLGAVNGMVKWVCEPLGQARTILNDKVMAWRRRERERVEHEQREREEAARRAQEEADRLEREAAAARAATAAPPAPPAPAAEAATLGDFFDQLDAGGAAAAPSARPTLDDAVRATQAADTARRVADEASTVAARPPDAAPGKTLTAATGARLTVKTHWTWAVSDATKIPRAFLIVDKDAVDRAIKAGVRDIPGLRIFPAESAAVTPSRSASKANA